MNYFYDNVSTNPIIASVRDVNSLKDALDSSCKIIFLLSGNIFNLKEISHKLSRLDKGIYIHVDSIDGFSKDTWGLEYIIKNIHPHGIITEKSNLVKLSKDMGMFTIQRVFISDSNALKISLDSIKKTRPNAIEILPGPLPKVISKCVQETNIPVIASGLISDKEDINSSLNAGAIAISSSNSKLW